MKKGLFAVCLPLLLFSNPIIGDAMSLKKRTSSIIVSQDGKTVTLDDGTMYVIAPGEDQNTAFGWLGGSQVTVGSDPANTEYPVTFTDSKGDVVHAKVYQPPAEAPSEDNGQSESGDNDEGE